MRCFALLAAFALSLAVLGCGSPEKKPPVVNKPEHVEEHHHPGPHGGLVAAIGDHTHHLEWTHNDKTNTVALIVLDAKKDKNVPIAMEKLVVVADGKEYTLDAVNPEEGKTARFELKDPDFLGVIESLSDKITAEVKEIE